MKLGLVMLGTMAMMLGACAMMARPDALVTLRLAPVFAPGGTVDKRSVAVAAVDATGVPANVRYAYVDPARPGEINQAKSLFWEVPPPQAVERALVAGLRSRFATVTGPEAVLPADIRVVAVLDRFEEISGEPGKAVVTFEASVIEHDKVTLAGKWCASSTFAGSGPSDRARAFEAALVSVATAFAQDVATGVPASDRTC